MSNFAPGTTLIESPFRHEMPPSCTSANTLKFYHADESELMILTACTIEVGLILPIGWEEYILEADSLPKYRPTIAREPV